MAAAPSFTRLLWGLHVSEGLYSGVPIAQGTGLGSRMTAYRWHVVDPVPFKSSLMLP